MLLSGAGTGVGAGQDWTGYTTLDTTVVSCSVITGVKSSVSDLHKLKCGSRSESSSIWIQILGEKKNKKNSQKNFFKIFHFRNLFYFCFFTSWIRIQYASRNADPDPDLK